MEFTGSNMKTDKKIAAKQVLFNDLLQSCMKQCEFYFMQQQQQEKQIVNVDQSALSTFRVYRYLREKIASGGGSVPKMLRVFQASTLFMLKSLFGLTTATVVSHLGGHGLE